MNKAEEQYLYQKEWDKAKSTIMDLAYDMRHDTRFAESLFDLCNSYNYAHNHKGRKAYYATIIHAIDCDVIKDWPSFVEYMTGETYE